MDPIIEHVRNAVVALCEGRVSEAEQELRAIDFPGLRRNHRAAQAQVWRPGGPAAGFVRRFPGTKRKNPSNPEKSSTFIRDRYTCRYLHCQRPTVFPDVLHLLSEAFGDVLPGHERWKGRDKHILYWTYSTNIEHLRSFTEVGPSAASAKNLITACYECGDIKSDLTIELLRWHVTEPSNTDWAGLTEYIPRLKTAIADLRRRGVIAPSEVIAPPEPRKTPKASSVKTSTASSAPQVGSLIRTQLPGKKKARSYCIDGLSDSEITLSEMWVRDRDNTWVASSRHQTFRVAEIQRFLVVRDVAPAEGEQDLC